MSLVAIVSLEGDDKDGDDVFLDFIDETRGFVDPAAPVPSRSPFNCSTLPVPVVGCSHNSSSSAAIFNSVFF